MDDLKCPDCLSFAPGGKCYTCGLDRNKPAPVSGAIYSGTSTPRVSTPTLPKPVWYVGSEWVQCNPNNPRERWYCATVVTNREELIVSNVQSHFAKTYWDSIVNDYSVSYGNKVPFTELREKYNGRVPQSPIDRAKDEGITRTRVNQIMREHNLPVTTTPQEFSEIHEVVKKEGKAERKKFFERIGKDADIVKKRTRKRLENLIKKR